MRKQVSLEELTVQVDYCGKLPRALNPFRDDRYVETLGERDDGRHDGRRLSFGLDSADERPVDLDYVDGEGTEVGKRRVAGPEVIERDTDAMVPQFKKDRLDGL